MEDQDQASIKLSEGSGIQFSLSFLIQILATVVLAVWGYSQLDARISQAEHTVAMNAGQIAAMMADIKESQNMPIPSDHVQNTTLLAHGKALAELKGRLRILEARLWKIK